MQLPGGPVFTLGVKPGGIGTTQLANASVTNAKLAQDGNQASGILSGSVATGFSGLTVVGTLSYVATGNARFLIRASAAANGGVAATSPNDASTSEFQWYLDGVLVSNQVDAFREVLISSTAGAHSVQLRYNQTNDGSFSAVWANIQIIASGF